MCTCLPVYESLVSVCIFLRGHFTRGPQPYVTVVGFRQLQPPSSADNTN